MKKKDNASKPNIDATFEIWDDIRFYLPDLPRFVITPGFRRHEPLRNNLLNGIWKWFMITH